MQGPEPDHDLIYVNVSGDMMQTSFDHQAEEDDSFNLDEIIDNHELSPHRSYHFAT